jgi:hypothetical protein
MLPTQKEAWGKSVSPEVNIQKTHSVLSRPKRESVNDGLGIEFDFSSLGWQFCWGGRKSRCLN